MYVAFSDDILITGFDEWVRTMMRCRRRFYGYAHR